MSEREHDEFIEGIAAELRRPVRVDPSFDAKVMAALEPQIIPLHGERRREGKRPWLLRPRTVSVSPLGAFGGLAVAAGLSAIVVLGVRRGGESGGTALPQQVATAPVQMHQVANGNAPVLYSQPFVFLAPEARSVALVGDFNDWDVKRIPLARVSPDGLWTVTVMLPPGRHEYQFVVDGTEWRQDPTAPQAPESDFGVSNSVVTVSGGAR